MKQTCWHKNIAVGDAALVKKLLDEGADINAKDDGLTLLMKAATEGYLKTAKLLIDKKADIDAKTNEGNTAQTLGGKPESHFGFLPMRTRWRDGEFSSPVAFDINEAMPVDLLIETYFSGTAEVQDSQSSLCQLPSGILRWQRPALMTYPGIDTCRQIWQMESSLTTPTDQNNLAQRLSLTERWMDLMMLEGFTPLPRAWGSLEA